jgi:hypothetical protein
MMFWDTCYNPNSGYWYGDYVMTISADPTHTQKIIVTNLRDAGEEQDASVTSNVLMITKQAFGSLEISGSASLSSTTLDLDFTVHDYESYTIKGKAVKR